MWELDQTSTENTLSLTGTATPLSSSTSNINSNTISTPTSTTTVKHSSALSGGAKAGIGVGAALAFAIGLVLLWLGWRCIKRRRGLSTPTINSQGAKHQDPSKIRDVNYFPVEADHREVSEVHGDGYLREVEGHHVAHRHEMEGVWRWHERRPDFGSSRTRASSRLWVGHRRMLWQGFYILRHPVQATTSFLRVFHLSRRFLLPETEYCVLFKLWIRSWNIPFQNEEEAARPEEITTGEQDSTAVAHWENIKILL